MRDNIGELKHNQRKLEGVTLRRLGQGLCPPRSPTLLVAIDQTPAAPGQQGCKCKVVNGWVGWRGRTKQEHIGATACDVCSRREGYTPHLHQGKHPGRNSSQGEKEQKHDVSTTLLNDERLHDVELQMGKE